jgi:hypothetical protein
MQNKKLLYIAIACCLAMSGCAATQSSNSYSAVYAAKVSPVTITPLPILVDVDVSEKRIPHKISIPYTPLISHKELREQAMGELLFQSGGDILLEPRYDIKQTDKEFEVLLSGFVGKYSNFRQAKLTDADALSTHTLLPTVVQTQSTTDVSKIGEKRVKPIVPILILSGLLILIIGTQ